MSGRPERDQMLERALATLAAPPTKARFRERLWERVDAAEHVDAVETPALLAPLEAPARRDRFHERLWQHIDAAEQVKAAETEPVGHPTAGRSRHRVSSRPRLAAAALVAAAVGVWLAVSLIGLPAGRERGVLSGPPPAVAQVIENVRLRLDSVRSLRAVFTYQRAGEPVYRASLVAASDGRTRTTSIAHPDGSWSVPPSGATLTDTPGLHIDVTSMPDGTRTEAWSSEGGPTVTRTTDLAPGPPDALGTGLFPSKYVGDVSALAIGGSKVTKSTYQGRPVVVVSASVRPTTRAGSGASSAPRFDRVSMTIDRSTWLPVRVVHSYKGALVEAWGFRDVELDPPLTAADFAVQLPSSARVITGQEQGFRRLTLQEASAVLKGRLYVPETLPDGFELALATVREPEATLRGSGQSDSPVASLVYRRGFRSIVVTTRPVRDSGSGTVVDPFPGASTHGKTGAADVVLGSGGLTGAQAAISTRPLGLPHLWLVQDGMLVTVAGDVSRRELVAIAESLDTYGVWRTAGVFRDYATATRAYDLGSLSDLYSRGITIDGRTYSLDERDEALIKNSEMTDYFVSGKALTPFVGDGAAVWEAFPGVYSAFGGGYDPEAVAEVVTIRGGKVVREDFHWVAGPSRKAGEKGPHPARVRGPLGPADTAAAARRIGLAYAAGMEAKDATRMAQMSAPGVAFLDVGYGDAGGRSALLRRYARMFRFPDDLALRSRLVASGPGWAAIRWTAASDSLGYDGAAGLTVLETRDGKVARETLYCAKDRMPFR